MVFHENRGLNPYIKDVTRRFALEGYMALAPDGLDTPVGEGGRGLSAGQTQRIALGRAFLRNAPLVVLDEPTAHLDAETATAIGEAIKRLAVGRTTLLITHDARLVARADRVVPMEHGRAIVNGALPRATVAA